MRLIISVCIIILLMGCSENKFSELDFLIGKWKTVGKEQYEEWEKNENNELIGTSTKYEGNQVLLSDNLIIKEVEGKIIYEAKVNDHNNGKRVQFVLNTENKEAFSFENNKNEFPKKIQYKILSDDKIEITISGDQGAGFSYFILRDDK